MLSDLDIVKFARHFYFIEMRKKLTNEEFLERLWDKNEHYRNGEFKIIGEYVDMKSKMLVGDNYGEYLIKPIVLLKGFNTSIKSAVCKTKHWILRAIELHGDKFDYSKVSYINDYINLNIICRLHGEFTIRGSAHLSGQGCKKCYVKNITSSGQVFINKAIVKHNNKYKYSNVEYKTSKDDVEIECVEHGAFYQTPNSHLRGQGCPKCNQLYNSCKKEGWIKKAKEREGIFYIIKCFNEEEEFYKLGITFRDIKKRYRLNDKKVMPYEYKVLKEVKSADLSYIWDLEKRFKRIKQINHYSPLIAFKGSVTECFKQ